MVKVGFVNIVWNFVVLGGSYTTSAAYQCVALGNLFNFSDSVSSPLR